MVRKDGIVKILDFGLGKWVQPAGISTAETLVPGLSTLETIPGTVLGTVNYMSPQQAGGRPLDFRSDQFSFGVILYEMITGKRPFERETPAQTLASIIQDKPAPIASLNPTAPATIQTIIERCLEKNPESRYPATGDLAQELRDLRDDLSNARHRFFPLPAKALIRRRSFWLGLLLAVLLLSGGILLISPSAFERIPGLLRFTPIPSEMQLVVLPFANVDNNPANQAFCAGLAEILTTKLSQLQQFQQGLRVVPASEVRSEKITSVREARKAFGITMAITGSAQRSVNRVRLTINLVDAGTLRQLDARSIDTEAKDISVLQDGVLLEVADMLEVKLPSRAKQVLAAGETNVPGAYQFYMQGRGYLQRYETAGNIETAIDLFKRALNQDSKYAQAYAGLGEAYWRKFEATKDPQWAEQAMQNCEAALKLNDTLAQVAVTLGMIEIGTGRYEQAIQRLQRALDLDPVNPDAYRNLGKAYQALGKLREAESTFRKAIEVQPKSWGSHNELGKFYFRTGRYQEAEKEFRRILELIPDNTVAYNNLGAMYYEQKRYEEAVAMFERLAAIKPSTSAYSNLGTVYFTLGRYSDAARTIEHALKLNDRISKFWYNLASTYLWAPGEREKAGAAFARAAELAEQELAINPRDSDLLIRLADCYSMLNQPKRSVELLGKALELAPHDVEITFQAAVVYEQLGDRKRALEWIGKAVQQGYSKDLIERSPSLARLRTDPRFEALRGR
jgi:serine/threonine-protein kinase